MFFIIIISLIIYTIATIAIYHNLYNFEKSKKIKFIILGYLAVLIITIIIVFISSANMEIEYKTYKEYINITKSASILLFAPINTILFLTYAGNVLNKHKDKRINDEQLKKKFIILFLLLIVIIIFEVGYIKDFETGLIRGAIN